MRGGYCAAPCGASCDGSCVETVAFGEQCLAACVRDADCRTRDGYTCDPAWHACTLPGTAAVVPRQCPTIGPDRDASFTGAQSIALGRDPAAAGSAVVFATDGGIATPTAVLGSGAAPALASAREGYVAAWRDGGISVATSHDRGATWSAARPIALPGGGSASDDCGDCTARPLAASNGSTTYVLYGGDDVGLRARRSRDGGATFDPAIAVARGSVGSAVVDRGGFLHTVTIRGGRHGGYGSAMQSIEYAVGGGAPITVSGRDEMLPTWFAAPAIAVDDDRKRVWIAYVRGGRDADWDLVIAMTRDGGKTWLHARIGDGCAVHAVPSLAIDPKTGTLHATFYDSAAMPGRYAHATCTLGSAVTCAVKGAISPRFAAFDLARSIGRQAALVIDRGMLHAYWTEALVDGLHVMHAQAKL